MPCSLLVVCARCLLAVSAGFAGIAGSAGLAGIAGLAGSAAFAEVPAAMAAAHPGISAAPPTAAGPRPADSDDDPAGDDPGAAQAQFLARRLPPAPAPGAPSLAERYLAAREHMRHMQHHTAGAGSNPTAATSLSTTPTPASGQAGRAASGQAMSAGAPAAALGPWQPLGPGNLGGRTRALLYDPVVPRTIYAAGVDGGVWKTLDAGATWAPLDDLMPNLAVSSLALDPGNRLTLYAGTGEGFLNADAVRGAGIFKTVDGGLHWQQLTATATPDFQAVNRLQVSARTRTIYAATGTGVWRSRNAGLTWRRVLVTQVEGGCLDLALRTDRPDDVVFAACGSFQQATVYQNLHAQKLTPWVPVLQAPGMGRTALAIAPSNPDVVYALATSNLPGPHGNYAQGLLAVFRSTTGGGAGSWTAQVSNADPNPLNTVLLSSTRFAFQHECGAGVSDIWSGRGWYDNVIAVDPADPDRVWAGGVDLFRSDDGGHTWGLANYWWAGANGAQTGFAHADQHALAFHPRYNGTTNQTLLVAGDGGIYRTTDARAPVALGAAAPCNTAASAVTWSSLDNGYAVTQFYQGAVFPGGTAYIGGAQDLGTVLGSDAAGPEGWRQVLDRDGGFVAIDPTNPAVVYAESGDLSLAKSTDGGNTFTVALNGIDSGTFPYLVCFILDPLDSQRLWLGGDSLWRSDDAAATWHRASLGLGQNGLDLVSAIAVSPFGSQHVLAGTSQGLIQRSDNALAGLPGAVWTPSAPRAGYVSSLVYDPQDPGTVYATYATFGGPHVWKSNDGGTTWLSIDGVGVTGASALPDLPVNALVVDPRQPRHLYLGTDLGVFSTLDGGFNWTVEDAAFANAETEALVLVTPPPGPHGAANPPWLFAFTHGRGVWKAQLPE